MKLGIRVFCLLLFTLTCRISLAQESTVEVKPKQESTVPYRIDVDMGTHSLTVFKEDKVIRTMHISGGGEYKYHPKYRDKRGRIRTSKKLVRAHTPRGPFTIFDRHPKWWPSEYGRLYYPIYFARRKAIHGADNVPKHHASHACIRTPKSEAPWLYRTIPNGTPVRIHD